MRSAVLFLTYRRFHTAEKVLKAIRQARPPRLYFASNGPNPGIIKEKEHVAKVRSLIQLVNWQCDVKTRFLNEHLPVNESIPSALDWFFHHEEQGIILEDDCLPNTSFFSFCDSLLDLYANDDRVSMITGNNFQNGNWRGDGSYFFSRYTHVWGWASWRRAWYYYDGSMVFWPEYKNSERWRIEFPDYVERKYWEETFDKMYAKKIDTWDYPWIASIWYRGGFTAMPNVNLVSNIGFGPDATHTSSCNSPLARMRTSSMRELIHPAAITRDRVADRYNFDYAFGGRDLRFPMSLLHIPRRIKFFLCGKLKKITKQSQNGVKSY